jgi:ABC-type oligopeptide transport system substrate-binding subunit
MTKFLTALILVGSLAVAACGGSGDPSTDAKVDRIMAEFERSDPSDAERDEMRDSINAALDALPSNEHDEYLDVLLESAREIGDAVEETGE